MEQIPILKIGDLLLVSIQVDLHDRLVMSLLDDITNMVVKVRAKGVLIDISALEIVDSFIGRMLSNIASITLTLGAPTVIVGMQPAVAITIVELGLSLSTLRTSINMDQGMRFLRNLTNSTGTKSGYERLKK